MENNEFNLEENTENMLTLADIQEEYEASLNASIANDEDLSGYVRYRYDRLNSSPMYRDDRGNWHPLPMSEEQELRNQEIASAVDGAVLARANELGWDITDLMDWMVSDQGKWFGRSTLGTDYSDVSEFILVAYKNSEKMIY